MSASGKDGTDAVVARTEGVEVKKSHEGDRFPVPAIVFSIRSEREEPVEIRLADRVPEGVSMDDVGFHPEYGSEFWSVEGRTLVFERELEGDVEVETVYGLRGPDAETADRFLGEPTIEVWTGGESGSSFVDDINDQLTRSATFADGENGERVASTAGATTESETLGGSEGAEGGEDDWDDEAVEAGAAAEADENGDPDGSESTEPGEEDDRESGRSDDGERSEDRAATEDAMDENTPIDTERGTDRTEADEPTVAEGDEDDRDDEALAARLARELRAGRVDSDDRETLRDALGPRESVDARIEHLRAQVNDVAAYADALEAFLDENGSGRTLIRRQAERLDALREDLEATTEQAAANREAVVAVESDVETIEGNIETIEENVEIIESDVDAFQTAVSDLDEEIERIDERFASIDERIERVESLQEEITERLDALEASHESDVTELREDVETRIDERIEEVERFTEAVESDVEALEAWRAQLAGALGGADGTDTDATGAEGSETVSDGDSEMS